MTRLSFAEAALALVASPGRFVTVGAHSDELVAIVDLRDSEYYSDVMLAATDVVRYEVGGDDAEAPFWTDDLREAYAEAVRRLDVIAARESRST